MKKKLINIVLLGCLVAIPSLFNSCGNGRFESIGNSSISSSSTGGGTLSAAAKCEINRQRAFSNTYYPFAKRNCVPCHENAGGSGFFASKVIGVAYNAFLDKTEARVYEYATSDAPLHKAGFTGSTLKATADPLRPTWRAAQTAYDLCILAAGSVEGTIQTIPVPSKFTIAKPFTVAPGTPVTMTWNTGSEMVNGANAFEGGTFSMVASVTDLGNNQGLFEFRNPRFVNANPTSTALIKGIAVQIKGVLVPGGSTFYTLERYIPNIANNNSRQLTRSAGGAISYLGPLNLPMDIQIGFTLLETAKFVFDPPVFATLAGTGGTFAAKCTSCHGNSGGLNLTVYNNVVGSVAVSGLPIVSKWSLTDSYLWEQVDGGLMPKAAPLTQPEKDRIRDWILDGAPNTAADVRR